MTTGRPPQQVLVAEDDADIADLVAHHLDRAGYIASIVHSGADVLPSARERRPDPMCCRQPESAGQT
jgi:DNA-binding response OmpR family regulator